MNLAEQLRAQAQVMKNNLDKAGSESIVYFIKQAAKNAAEKGKFSLSYNVGDQHWEIDHVKLAMECLKQEGFTVSFFMRECGTWDKSDYKNILDVRW